jgi:hypothetical protein
MNRGRIGILIIGSYLTILLIGVSWGSANAQVKLVKPASGGTIVINKAGSYFLGSNLSFGASNASAIRVNSGVNNVTINLNGFSIIGTGGSNSGGINASTNSGITIVNGTITKMAGNGIALGSNSTVAGVQLINNGGNALTCTTGCLIISNVINGNTGTGLVFSDATSGYQNNILSGNGTNVTGGTNMGHNVCGSALCP